MVENKTKPTLQRVEAFLDGISDEVRRADAKVLVKLMEEITGEEATMWGPAIVGFGRYGYKYASGREGETMVVGFSPRKAAVALYGLTGYGGAETLLARLGGYTRGKGCLYLKRVDKVDGAILRDLIVGAVTATRTRMPSEDEGRGRAGESDGRA